MHTLLDSVREGFFMNRDKVTVLTLKKMKDAQEKITMLTAYDYPMARLLDQSGIDILLVGDSLGMAFAGDANTLSVTMDQMLYHTSIVAKATQRAMVVGDMPFMSYQLSPEQAAENAGKFIAQGKAGAVKLEGGCEFLPQIRAILRCGIPVMGHLGLTPQSVHKLGGYKVQGGREEEARKILEDAQAMEAAGIFSLVLECIPADLAEEITHSLSIPTIGIGAGVHCDGQVLVTHDMLGLFDRFTPKFVKKYLNLSPMLLKAFEEFQEDVREGRFPAEEHSFCRVLR